MKKDLGKNNALVNEFRTTLLRAVPQRGLISNRAILSKRVHFLVYDNVGDHTVLGMFTFSPMPGCCGVVVSTDSRNYNPGRLSSVEFHKLKEHVAGKLGYGAMLATSVCSNFSEIIGAVQNKWNLIHPFRNPRTNRDVTFMIKILKELP